MDVEELEPQPAQTAGVQLALAKEGAKLRVEDVQHASQRRPAALAEQLGRAHGDFRVDPVIAAEAEQVAGAGDAGFAQQPRLGGVADQHYPAQVAALAHQIVLGVLLDHHHGLTALQEAAGQDQALAPQPADHHVLAPEAQPQGTQLAGKDSRQRLQSGVGGDQRGQDTRRVQLPRHRRVHADLEHEQLARLEDEVQPFGRLVFEVRLELKTDTAQRHHRQGEGADDRPLIVVPPPAHGPIPESLIPLPHSLEAWVAGRMHPRRGSSPSRISGRRGGQGGIANPEEGSPAVGSAGVLLLPPLLWLGCSPAAGCVGRDRSDFQSALTQLTDAGEDTLVPGQIVNPPRGPMKALDTTGG